MSILSTTTASWIVDVSHYLGLVDLDSCRLYSQKKEKKSPAVPQTTAPPRPSASFPHFTPSNRKARKRSLIGLALTGTRFSSSPCLASTKTRFHSSGSLADESSAEKLLKKSAPSYKSCERIPSLGGDSAPPTPPPRPRCNSVFSASASNLDCSVNYSDGPTPPQKKAFETGSSEHLFSSARTALVHRVCGAPANAPPLPGSEHPPRSHRGMYKTRRSRSHGVVPNTRDFHCRPAVFSQKQFHKCKSLPDILCKEESSLKKSGKHPPPLKGRRCSSDDVLCSRENTAEGKGKKEESFLDLWIQWRFGSDLHGNAESLDASSQDSCEVATQKVLRRTRSDMSKSSPYQRHLLGGGDPHYRQSLGRQYSSPQPIKVRPFHRLPNYSVDTSHVSTSRLKRSKGSAHLRRSVSQPLDLDKSFQAQVSFLKMRAPEEDSSTHKQRRRPSVGNLLSDDNTSEDEEGGMSDTEETKHGFKRSLDEDDELIVFAEALWDHVSLDSDELVFKAGDLITVVDSSDKDWWWGRSTHRSGWFPASFVRLLVNQEDHQGKVEGVIGLCDGGQWSPRKASLSTLSQDQVRANVVNEILSTERDYVKHLRDVVEGYLRQVRKRPDMFSEERIATIFGNMEMLFHFHRQFLSELERCIDYDQPHRSCIGECFIRNKNLFEIYSEYCNNHPSAISELQELYQDQKYIHFFEACRLLQEMIDISLDGFLLTPVQKICKYPLQLQELLKYTRPKHSDYATVHGAMQAMREVALLVNERRRRLECLEKLALWQKGLEGWEGPDLLDDSSQLIHQGEATKGVGGSWPKEVTLFLFDHQLVYCKRDLLKRNTFVYRGRINTDLCEVIDIPDDPMRGAALQNAWKIHCLHKSKTYVFTCKTAAEKAKWLQAFRRERALVAMDEASGFVASEKQKQVARMAAKNQRSRPKKPRMKLRARKQVMTYAQAQQLVNTDENRCNSLPVRGQQAPLSESKKKGHWFSFGGHRKNRNLARTQKHNSFHNS